MIAGIVAGQAAGAASDDPYFSMVATLLHFDGADGSTVFTDQKANTWSVNGSAQIDTAIKKFGTGSGLFLGGGACISTPYFPALSFAANDMCAEAWVYPTNATGGTNIGGTWYQSIMGQQVIGSSGNSSFALALADLKPTGGLFQSGNIGSPITSATALTLNAWSHVAFTRSGSTVRMFINGLIVGSNSFSGSVDSSSRLMTVGADSSFASALEGHIDELRITNGNSRYTANFTPPTEPFPD